MVVTVDEITIPIWLRKYIICISLWIINTVSDNLPSLGPSLLPVLMGFSLLPIDEDFLLTLYLHRHVSCGLVFTEKDNILVPLNLAGRQMYNDA